MKASRGLLLLVLVGCGPASDGDSTETPIEPIEAYDPLPLVDPFIATGGVGAEIASVSPGASMPFGMTLAGPDTRASYGAPGFYHCAGYYYEDTHIQGFSQTHAHGMGVPDYGSITVMPRASWDESYTEPKGRAAPFSHDEEEASPGHYGVVLQDDGTRVDIVATTHGAHHRYTFAGGSPVVLFDLGAALGEDRVDEANLTIDLETGRVEGFQRLMGSYSERFGGLRTSFVAQLDPAPVAAGTWTDPDVLQPDTLSAAGTIAGAWLVFPEGTTTVDLRVALSTVDLEGARGNLAAELPDTDLDARRAEAEAAWREELSGVRVRGGTEAQRRTFHSAHYHASLMPSTHSDVDGRYRGLDGEVHSADFTYYSDFSLWDTFRTLHSFYVLAKPARQVDMLRSLIRMSEDGGSLPRWPLAHGYTGGMVGSPAQQVFAESWLKGLTGWDAEAAWDIALQHSMGPMPHAGRGGIESYLSRGYVSVEAAGGSVSDTLEYAWSDGAMALWADAMGKPEADTLRQQSMNWRNHWDPESGFLIGRHDDGRFTWNGSEFGWDDIYVEGNAWHYVWMAPHDVEGLIEVEHGGDRDAFLDRLGTYWDEVADEDDDKFPDDWYWHGNEPVMHYAALGSLAGDVDTSSRAFRWVLEHRYDDTPAGLDGNDDSGTLSAWFLLASMGVFPVAGTETWVATPPLFERTEIDRPDGTMWVIDAPGAGEKAWVQGVRLDGEEVGPTFTHGDWAPSGALRIDLGADPAGR